MCSEVMGVVCSKEEEVVRKKSDEEEAIKKFVEQLLEKESINMSWMPDEVEKEFYCRTLQLVLAAMKTMLESVSVLNHTVSLKMEPQKDQDVK